MTEPHQPIADGATLETPATAGQQPVTDDAKLTCALTHLDTRAAAEARNRAAHAPTIAEQVAAAPIDPGCYLWKDAEGNVLYVGKAKNLRARLRQYVQLTDERPMVPRLMAATAGFDYVVVEYGARGPRAGDQPHQPVPPALQRRPQGRQELPLHRASPRVTSYPAIKYTRERHRAGTRYFGPYTDARAARATIDVARTRRADVRCATCAEWQRVTPPA